MVGIHLADVWAVLFVASNNDVFGNVTVPVIAVRTLSFLKFDKFDDIFVDVRVVWFTCCFGFAIVGSVCIAIVDLPEEGSMADGFVRFCVWCVIMASFERPSPEGCLTSDG